MGTSVFILGREPHLSVAELRAVLGDRVDWSAAALGSEALVMPAAAAIDPDALIERLGGMVKIGRSDAPPTTHHAPRDLVDADAVRDVIERHASGTGKLRFGISAYDAGGGTAAVARVRREFRRIGPAVKRGLAAATGRPVRWVTSREPTLSSVVVAEQGLLPDDGGVEVLVLVTAHGTMLSRTLAVQPYADWSARDYGRPSRSMVRGMLPPKLARIMVNIAAPSRKPPATSCVVLDPFCGTGTVLLEAHALGYRAIGTDVDPQAIAEARENLAWQRGHRGQRDDTSFRGHGKKVPATSSTPPTSSTASVQCCDVRQLSRCIREQVDAIVTEPYLGPPTRSSRGRSPRHLTRRTSASGEMAHPDHPSELEMSRLVEQLHALYVAAFREFARVLKPGGRVVFVVPEFRAGASVPRGSHRADHHRSIGLHGIGEPKKPRPLEIGYTGSGDGRAGVVIDITADVVPLGFQCVDPFPAPLRDHPLLAAARDLPYARPDQRVGRRILVFERSGE